MKFQSPPGKPLKPNTVSPQKQLNVMSPNPTFGAMPSSYVQCMRWVTKFMNIENKHLKFFKKLWIPKLGYQKPVAITWAVAGGLPTPPPSTAG